MKKASAAVQTVVANESNNVHGVVAGIEYTVTGEFFYNGEPWYHLKNADHKFQAPQACFYNFDKDRVMELGDGVYNVIRNDVCIGQVVEKDGKWQARFRFSPEFPDVFSTQAEAVVFLEGAKK